MSEALNPHETAGNDNKLAGEVMPADVPATASETFPRQPPARRSAWHYVFMGPGGLRPGWGLLIFASLFVLFALSIQFASHKLHPRPVQTEQQKKAAISAPTPPKAGLIGEGSTFAAIALVTWIMGRIERRPVGVYGFGGTGKMRHFSSGFLWGFAFLTVLVGALWKAGLLVFDGRLLSSGAVFKYATIWLAGFLFVGLAEEYLLRGYLQYTLSRGFASLYEMLFDTSQGKTLGFWTAALILSFLFGLGHSNNPGESPIGLVSAGLIGLIFCLTLWKTGSLWWALGFHASWDWAQSFVFGVADSGTMVQGHLLATHPIGKVLLSGGATGPEGSAFILPLLLLVTLVVIWTLPGTYWPAQSGPTQRQALIPETAALPV